MSLLQVDLRAEYKHEMQARFNSESWSISELYWSQIRDYDTGKVKKCTVSVSDKWNDDKMFHYTSWQDSKGINMPFDFEEYLKANKRGRKQMLLDVVHAGMLKIAEKEGWSVDPLLDAYNKCQENDLEYRSFVRKPKNSPDRRHKMNFWFNWDIDVFEVYWVLYDKRGDEIKRKKLMEKLPHEGEFIYYIDFRWIDNSTVLLEDKYKYGKKEKWIVEIESEASIE